jgi:hypothetical protein
MLVNAFKTSDELCVDYVMIARKIPVVFGSVDVRQANGFAEASVGAEASLQNDNLCIPFRGRAPSGARRNKANWWNEANVMCKQQRKAEESSTAQGLPCLEGLVRSEAEHGSAADPGRDGY